MKKRIGITGASGFIGKFLIQKLLNEGYSIKALVRSEPSLLADVEVVQGELTDVKAVDSFLQNIDILIHLAGRQLPPKNLFFQDNVTCTNLLFNQAKNSPIEQAIFLSTAAVYGDHGNKTYIEDDECNPDTYYALTKYLAEELCQYWQRVTKQKLTILRPFNVYGKGSMKGVVFTMIESVKKTNSITIYGDGNQSRDFLYVDDLIEAIFTVIKEEQSGIFNLGSGEKFTIRELAEKIKELSSDRIKIEYKPSEVGKTNDIEYSIDHAHSILRWEAKTSLVQGLKKLL